MEFQEERHSSLLIIWQEKITDNNDQMLKAASLGIKTIFQENKIVKRHRIVFVLAAIMALSLICCGEKEPSGKQTEQIEAVLSTEAASYTETISDSEFAFSFEEFKNLQFIFSSGAGGWATEMYINADGSFHGKFYDSDMGSIGEGYPYGTEYHSDFYGQFTQPVRVNDYTYSMQIQELNYEEEIGTEEIIDGILYQYIDAYGLGGAEDILIYLPGAPLAELPEEFRGWIGCYDLSQTENTELSGYALNNETQQYGFMGYDRIDSIRENIAYIEEWAAVLEDSIQNDFLTQTEYNVKTQELYETWDSALNIVWSDMEEILDEETMSALTVQELEWIAMKEKAVEKVGAAYEDGTRQPMVMNQKAAELTKDRVYELLEILDALK